MPAKEAKARIKINKLLEEAGWRFFDDAQGVANVALEPNVKLTQIQVDALGNDFESSSNGFIDFLLLDDKGFPLVVLEAKAESKNPLIGKEQARKYAKSQNCRFVISFLQKTVPTDNFLSHVKGEHRFSRTCQEGPSNRQEPCPLQGLFRVRFDRREQGEHLSELPRLPFRVRRRSRRRSGPCPFDARAKFGCGRRPSV
jgi:hypothetical protein